MKDEAAVAVSLTPDTSRASLGDFQSLYQSIKRAADRAALVRVGRQDDRDDVVQEVCISAWRCWSADGEYFVRRNLLAWAALAVRNRYYDMIKSSRVRRRSEAGFMGDYGAYQRPWMDPALGLSYRALVAVTQDALAELGPRCRQSYVAVRFHGLSYKEAGDQLGLALRTIAGYVVQAQVGMVAALSAWRNDNA